MHFDNNSMTHNIKRTKQREASVHQYHFHLHVSVELIPRRIGYDRMISARAKEGDFFVYVTVVATVTSSQGSLGDPVCNIPKMRSDPPWSTTVHLLLISSD